MAPKWLQKDSKMVPRKPPGGEPGMGDLISQKQASRLDGSSISERATKKNTEKQEEQREPQHQRREGRTSNTDLIGLIGPKALEALTVPIGLVRAKPAEALTVPNP